MAAPASSSCGPESCTPHDTATTARKIPENQTSRPVDVATLREDIAVVQATLELPWTTSLVEGQISHLKMIKRTMYGRAGLLLRTRVLNAG